MRIGVPKEVKASEYRVGLIPSSVFELVRYDHDVLVEQGAGKGIGFTDQDYEHVGAVIVKEAKRIFEQADMIVKVKEPQLSECAMLREDQILFTFLHLAADPKQADALQQSKCVAIAYETVTDSQGGLPLLLPMSQVAGRLSIQVGAHYLEKIRGGSGILLAGVPGVHAGKVVVLGGGVVGTNAMRMAIGQEADVTMLDRSLRRLRALDLQFGAKINTVYATQDAIDQYVSESDLVIGAVLVPGGVAPRLVDRALLKKMRPGSVVVDVAIDQGGCFETSRPTSHVEPTYVEEGIAHYCVSNMPGAVPRTAAYALNNATLPFVIALANKGYQKAMLDNRHLLNGLNVYHGHITHAAIARDLKKACVPAEEVLM